MVAHVLSVVLKIVIGFKEGESGFFNHFFQIPENREEKVMKHTEKELIQNICDSLIPRLNDAENHELAYIELPLSIEQARWLGRKMSEIAHVDSDLSFEYKPYNYEYDLHEEDQTLPSESWNSLTGNKPFRMG